MPIPLIQSYYGSNDGSPLLGYIFLVVIALIVIALIRAEQKLKELNAHWHYMFDSPPFTSQEFYTHLTETIKEKGIRGLEISRTLYAQGGILDPKREYLRVLYKKHVFDICAAPFAKGFFVSWWLGEIGNPGLDFLISIPLLGRLFRRRGKTFYELDTELMFRETIKECVKESIEVLSAPKGLRKLTERDWQVQNNKY